MRALPLTELVEAEAHGRMHERGLVFGLEAVS